MLSGKTVVVGVTGGIAAYKTASLVSALKKQGAEVHVIMTQTAAEFIAPLTFETLSNNRCIVGKDGMFDRNFEYDLKHISLAKAAAENMQKTKSFSMHMDMDTDLAMTYQVLNISANAGLDIGMDMDMTRDPHHILSGAGLSMQTEVSAQVTRRPLL